MSDPKMIRVRIPVCVNAEGDWNAVSWRAGMESGDDVVQTVEPMDGYPTHVVYVTAMVPVPQDPGEVEGTVIMEAKS